MINVMNITHLPQEYRPEDTVPEELPKNRREPDASELQYEKVDERRCKARGSTYHSQPLRHSPGVV